MYTVNHSGAKRKKQLIVLLLVFALILTLSVGTALAFLAMRTNPLENIFQPAEITCAIEENFDGSRKSDVRIRNTGHRAGLYPRRSCGDVGKQRRQCCRRKAG